MVNHKAQRDITEENYWVVLGHKGQPPEIKKKKKVSFREGLRVLFIDRKCNV